MCVSKKRNTNTKLKSEPEIKHMLQCTRLIQKILLHEHEHSLTKDILNKKYY